MLTLALLVLALLVLAGWRAWQCRGTRDTFFRWPHRIEYRLTARYAQRIGCVEGWSCSGRRERNHYKVPRWYWSPRARRANRYHRGHRHDYCVSCSNITCESQLMVDPNTGRRRKQAVCKECRLSVYRHQDWLRRERRERDWQLLTDPVDDSTLTYHVMPEQYAGPTRATLRAFAQADADAATVAGITAATLNQSIAVLGLQDRMYAEQRDDETVLRRVTTTPATPARRHTRRRPRTEAQSP
jgi:hypothetical protein